MTDVTVATSTAVVTASTTEATISVVGAGSATVSIGPGGFGEYGSFYDTTNQTGGTTKAFTLNSTDFASSGVSIANGSQITFTTIGKYNLAFSAQLIKTGGQSAEVYIWLRHQGADVAESATILHFANNFTHLVAAWNFFLDVNTSPQYFELMWYTASSSVTIGHIDAQTSPVAIPGVPSIILTVNQVG